MPSQLLFDISNIDPQRPIMDRAEIATWIPHRGPIFMLNAILALSDPVKDAVAIAHIPEDPWWAEGHIPGHPLMPGVLQIEAAAQLASIVYYIQAEKNWFAGFTRINDVTFRGQVKPGDDLILLSSATKYSQKRFVSNIQAVVDGNIVMDGSITGMAFPQMGNDIERKPLTQADAAPHVFPDALAEHAVAPKTATE